MEIDDKLKNRLAGTAVVTVLAIIFLPMLFESPPEKKAPVVSALDIPRKAEVSPLLTTTIVPDKTTEVVAKPKPTASTAEAAEKTKATPELASLSHDSDVTAQEDENPASGQKKSHKKTEDADVVAPIAENPVKKNSKSELPSLAENEEAQKSLPSLDPESTAGKRRWVIQVASLTDKAKANELKEKLVGQGFPATVDPVWLKGKGRVYRLKVGPELDAEKAKTMKNKINQLNNVSSIAIAE